MKTKLILVEGIPGSGKTTMAKNIFSLLKEQSLPVHLYTEGNPKHPADFEGIACLTSHQYKELLGKHHKAHSLIESITTIKGDFYFLSYYEGSMNHPDFSDSLYSDLENFDVYQLPLHLYCQLIKERWRDFVTHLKKKEEIYVFECCFMQNPINLLLARDNRTSEEIKKFMNELSEIIKPLQPVLVYNYQDSVEETLEKVIEERSNGWFEHVTWYFTGQAYGRENELSGKKGVINYLKHRKTIELSLVNEFDLDMILVDNSDYDFSLRTKEVWERIQHFLC